MNISKHAMQRYAERIMEKDDKTDVVVFINNHQDKIKQDIEKMIEYGECIYTGRPTNDSNKETVQVFLKDTWVLIIDEKKENVITLYSIDLGVGKEFNDDYVNRMLTKLSEAKETLKSKEEEIETQMSEYQKIIEDNKNTIAEYKKLTSSLEEQNKTYQELIFGLSAGKKEAEINVKEIVGQFIGKRIF